STNTNMTGGATITQDQAIGGEARLYRDNGGTPVLLDTTDTTIAPGQSSVSFNLGLPDNPALQLAVPEDTWTITVQLQDAAGNIRTGTMGGSLIADYTTPPATGLNVEADGGAPVGYANANSTEITMIASINTGGAADADEWVAELLLGFTPFGTSVTQTNLASGSISLVVGTGQVPEGDPVVFRIQVTEPSGNQSVSTDTGTIIVDYTPPALAGGITAIGQDENLVSGYLNSTNNNLEVTVTGLSGKGAEGGTAEVFKGGGAFTPVLESDAISGDSATFDLGIWGETALQDAVTAGTYDLTVRLTDAAGNLGSWSGTIGTLIADYTNDLSIAIGGAHSLDTNHDGETDTLELEFNEAVYDSLTTPGDWRMRVSGPNSYDSFGNWHTDVSSVATANVSNDKYLRLTLTPNNIDSTWTMQMQIDNSPSGQVLTDRAGNPIDSSFPGWSSSWTEVTVADEAPAVLLSVTVVTDNGGAGFFNADTDELELTFSEDLDDTYFSTWTIPGDLEEFFEIGGADPLDVDGGNFNNQVVVTLGGSDNILQLYQNGAGSCTAPFDTTVTPTTIAVAVNTTTTTHYLYGADGNLVYAPTVTPPSFSVVGSSGMGGMGGVVITRGPNAGGSAATRSSTQTPLVLPSNWPSMDQSGGSGESAGENPSAAAPYSAPAVERRNQSTRTAATGRSAATNVVAPPPPVQSEEAPKTVSVLAKGAAPPADADPAAVVAVTATVSDDGTSEDPVVVAQSPPGARGPAGTVTGRGAATAAGGEPAARSSTAAILALAAIMVILAGAALMVLSRLGRGVAKKKDGENRAE
ncbi:MAG: hypothetical protein KAU31_03795, partial [Spirochaetaceae bacterium]|nr:hypothetical protein [Spirochaetaceae bacterium]